MRRSAIKKELILPSVRVEDGDYIEVQDSRGSVHRGVFRGFAAGFIALSPDCGTPPTFFLNIRRVNLIVVLRENLCPKGENSVDEVHAGGAKRGGLQAGSTTGEA